MKLLSVLAVLMLVQVTFARREHPPKFSPSPFEVKALNSPVKEENAKFLLKTPPGFEIDKVQVFLKNANHFKVKQKKFQDVQISSGSQGNVLQVDVKKLPPGFYQLFVKVKDKKKEHDYKSKYHDHVRFVIDESLEVPAPDPKENDKTVKGIDSDNDGIRDDVQRLINSKYGNDRNTKLALKQLATAYQMVLTTAENKQDSIEAVYSSFRGIDCLLGVLDFGEAFSKNDEIKSIFLNTIDRVRASKKADINFHGEGGRSPDNKLAECQFEVN